MGINSFCPIRLSTHSGDRTEDKPVGRVGFLLTDRAVTAPAPPEALGGGWSSRSVHVAPKSAVDEAGHGIYVAELEAM